jgi:quercetin dioxygenase-like cupin family protein
MPIIKLEDSKRFEMHGAEFSGLAAPSRGSRENAVWRVRLPAGAAGVVHQLTKEEIVVALTGEAEVKLGDQIHRLLAGNVVVIPPGIDFSLSVPDDNAFEAIAILPVGGMAAVGGGPPFTPPWAQ